MAHVITLPETVTGRAHARRLLPAGSAQTTFVLDAGTVRTVSTAAVDELVRGLLLRGADRVIVVNASAVFERAFRLVHRARTRPERTFLLLFRQVPADALLRGV